MLHNLEKFTRRYFAFSVEELFSIANLFEPVSIDKKDILIKTGPLDAAIYFLDNGILKSYIEKNKKQYDTKFYFGPVFFSDSAGIRKLESARSFVTVKEQEVFIAKFEDVVALNEKSENHKRFFEMIFEHNDLFNSHESLQPKYSRVKLQIKLCQIIYEYFYQDSQS